MAKEKLAIKSLKPIASDATANSSPKMHVKIYTPFKIYFDGMADSVTAENDTGTFDILPRHHNFLCKLVKLINNLRGTCLNPCEKPK